MKLLNGIGKNMRSIIALLIIVGGFIYMHIHTEQAAAMLQLITMVAGYYFLDSKNRSDELKAKIEIEKTEAEKIENINNPI